MADDVRKQQIRDLGAALLPVMAENWRQHELDRAALESLYLGKAGSVSDHAERIPGSSPS